MRAPEPAGQIKPEIEILLRCAKKTLALSESSWLGEIPAARIDWPLLLQLATANGLLPLVCEHLLGNSTMVPPEAAARFRDANRRNVFRALFLTAELLRITESLRRRQIPALSYKGPVLGQLAYANPLLRQFDDLDLVVPQRFMPQVYEEMETLGYEPKFPRDRFLVSGSADIPGEYVFLHKVNGAMVEWHTESTLRHFPRPPNLEQMARRATTVSLSKKKVPTFAPADSLLMLCVHGAKDFWSRLVWVSDVAALAQKLTDADGEELLREADNCDGGRMVRLGLWLATSIFGFTLSGGVSQSMEQDRVARRMGLELREQLLDRRQSPAGLAWRSLYRIRTVARTGQGIRYWLRLSTAPAEEDWSATERGPLPRARYALLRPLRLWRKYRQSSRSAEPGGRDN